NGTLGFEPRSYYALPESMDIVGLYGFPDDEIFIIGYGVNAATAFYDGALSDYEKERTSNREVDWKRPSEEMHFADCSWTIYENWYRPNNRLLRVANAEGDWVDMEIRSGGGVVPEYARHTTGSNVTFLDGHGEAVT